MHRHPQTQSYVGSSGQTLTTNVSMTLCNWQIRHQTHVLCGRTTLVLNQIRSQINTIPDPAVWTRASLLQRGVPKMAQTDLPNDTFRFPRDGHFGGGGGSATIIHNASVL